MSIKELTENTKVWALHYVGEFPHVHQVTAIREISEGLWKCKDESGSFYTYEAKHLYHTELEALKGELAEYKKLKKMVERHIKDFMEKYDE